jgi:hypothetical protein
MLKLGRKGYRKFHGCNEDCFNCPYPDCYKPIKEMKPLRETADISRVDKMSGNSQGNMYTLELGGYGGAKPNMSRKFMR